MTVYIYIGMVHIIIKFIKSLYTILYFLSYIFNTHTCDYQMIDGLHGNITHLGEEFRGKLLVKINPALGICIP